MIPALPTHTNTFPRTRTMRPRTPSRPLALFVSAAVLACAGPAYSAGEAAGTAAGSFLSVGSGASVLSMGGATLAGGRDLASASWNAASLARLDALQFSITHAPLPGGATQDWFAAGGRIAGGETRWALQTLFQREGGIEGRDASNNPTGTLTASDLALGARVARRIGSRVDVGAGAEWVRESLADASGSGFAFDAGLRTDAGPFGFALAARHLGGGMSYGGVTYDLPAVIAAGMSWADAARGLRLNADLESPTHYYNAVRIGGEWMWKDQVALRAGYRSELGGTASERLSGASFGLGTGVGGMWLDYAFAPEGAAGTGQHRMGLTFRPGASDRDRAVPQTTQVTPRAPKATTSAPIPAPRRTKPAPKPEATATAPAGASSKPAPVIAAPAPMPVPAAPAPTKPAPEVTAPAPSVSAPAPSAPPERPNSVVLGNGETLADLARRWKTSVPAIMMVNNLVSERVQPGTRLKLPPANRP